MITAGDVLEHPVTRERIIFRQTARDTGGALAQADFFIPPGGFVAAEHIHPLQEERFEVLAGLLRGRAAGREVTAGPGETVIIPAGTPHVWWNDGQDELHALVELRPALGAETFFASLFGLAQDGKTSPRTGLPNPLQLAVIMRAHRDLIILARPARPVQAALFGALALIGRRLGYKAAYPYPRARPTHTGPPRS